MPAASTVIRSPRSRIVGKKLPQMDILDLFDSASRSSFQAGRRRSGGPARRIVDICRLVRRACADRSRLPCRSARLAHARRSSSRCTSIRSFQDLTNDSAPSSCSSRGQRIDVDAGFAERCQTPSRNRRRRRQRRADFAMIGESLQRAFRHGVHGERRGERLDVENVGRLRILGARAGPQQPLRPRAGIEGALPARRGQQLAIRLVGALGDGDAEPIGQLGSGTLPATATSQRLTKTEATEPTAGLSPASMRRSTPRR